MRGRHEGPAVQHRRGSRDRPVATAASGTPCSTTPRCRAPTRRSAPTPTPTCSPSSASPAGARGSPPTISPASWVELRSAGLAVTSPRARRPLHRHPRHLLAALNDVVHAEVRKLYPDSIVPDFTMLDDAGADGAADAPIRLRYESPRGLCLLAEGLVLGAADHFGERLAVTQTSCRHRGDAECILEASPLAEGAP
ncbi:MAG: heme NO-binding domain-containing protein [Steroidobacteraceae bacterium]